VLTRAPLIVHILKFINPSFCAVSLTSIFRCVQNCAEKSVKSVCRKYQRISDFHEVWWWFWMKFVSNSNFSWNGGKIIDTFHAVIRLLYWYLKCNSLNTILVKIAIPVRSRGGP
jgi:hypothetical protein